MRTSQRATRTTLMKTMSKDNHPRGAVVPLKSCFKNKRYACVVQQRPFVPPRAADSDLERVFLRETMCERVRQFDAPVRDETARRPISHRSLCGCEETSLEPGTCETQERSTSKCREQHGGWAFRLSHGTYQDRHVSSHVTRSVDVGGQFAVASLHRSRVKR